MSLGLLLAAMIREDFSMSVGIRLFAQQAQVCRHLRSLARKKLPVVRF